MPDNTYGQDLAILRQHTDVIELTAGENARIVVAPEFQGRVMTSTLAGDDGASYGWLNVPFIESGVRDDPVFNNFGGEDRYWIGPEAGQYALWYQNGEPFDLDHWKTPAGFTTGPWDVAAQDDTSVILTKTFEVSNYSGTSFRCAAKRTVRTLTAEQVTANLSVALPDGVKVVAYESENDLTNADTKAWTREGGLVGIWILGMMKALPNGKAIIPFVTGDEADLGPKAQTDYFGALPAECCTVADDHLWYKVDGKYRGKIGVSPQRSREVFGSYDPDANTLTIIQFKLPEGAASLPYVNSQWQIQDTPFAGDAINSYNDSGAVTDEGVTPTFFELESSSPAAELAPNETISHVHRTAHFHGSHEVLRQLALDVLGVDLDQVM